MVLSRCARTCVGVPSGGPAGASGGLGDIRIGWRGVSQLLLTRPGVGGLQTEIAATEESPFHEERMELVRERSLQRGLVTRPDDDPLSAPPRKSASQGCCGCGTTKRPLGTHGLVIRASSSGCAREVRVLCHGLLG